MLQADKGFTSVCFAQRKHLGAEGSSGTLFCGLISSLASSEPLGAGAVQGKSPRGQGPCSCSCVPLELCISRDIPTPLLHTQPSLCPPPLQPWAEGCSLTALTGAVQAPCLLRLTAAFIYTATASCSRAKNKRLALSQQIAFSASCLWWKCGVLSFPCCGEQGSAGAARQWSRVSRAACLSRALQRVTE